MPLQPLLPNLLEGATRVGNALSILQKDGTVWYFYGDDNYFSHPEGDSGACHYVLATLMDNGRMRPCELEQAPLCIPHRTLMNWLKQLREKGHDSFFRPVQRAGARVLTPDKVSECESLLAEGLSVCSVAERTGVRESTLRKGIGREAVRKAPSGSGAAITDAAGTTKSERSRADAQAASGMGTACTRADERVAAAMGLADSAPARFEHSEDVMLGGLLVGLPALCENGLLTGIGGYINLPKGFYSCLHILLCLGFMALARIRRPEGLRHLPPGELGKVIGLDRVPEVRTLRAKVTEMADQGDPAGWMKACAARWMKEDPAQAGYLYVDGHVNVYSGHAANLPVRYVSRQRLCLRGTTDYWVNDALGRPFFVVPKAVTDGLGATLLKDIVPQLLATVPGQPSQAELEADPFLHRFVVIFDREGATHALLDGLWQHRIGAITYRKNVTDVWPENEFIECEAPVPGGGSTRMKLALRETALSADKKSIAVTEVRRLTQTGHQTAIITTAKLLGTMVIAGRMFARWCQENYFAYMMQHYDIDGLVQYGAEPLPGTVEVVNPAWRTLDKQVKTINRALQKLHRELGRESHEENGADSQRKAELLEDIQNTEAERKRFCAERKKTAKKVALSELPEDQRPTRLLPLNKVLTDTVKMIAYRAETALVALLIRHLKKEDEARALVRELFVSSADIEPDASAKTLTVRIHRMACPAHDKSVEALLNDLNELAFCHPETGATMIYTLA
jgi:hypothetical protein